MKIKPLKRHSSPAYPSQSEIKRDPDLLRKLPKRWSSPTKSLAFLSMVSLLSEGLTVSAEENKNQTELVQTVDKREKADESMQKEPSELVSDEPVFAPVLAEALKNDGRGAFGCIVMNPPTFLPEHEALEIIMNELDKNGFKYKKNVTLKGISVPVDPFESSDSMFVDDEEETGSQVEQNGNKDREVRRMKKGEFDFDLGSKDGTIVIEYFARSDYYRWMRDQGTATMFDFPKLIQAAEESFKRYNKQKIFGLFFDPLAHNQILEPDLEGLKDPRLRERASEEYRKAIKKAEAETKKVAEEKLRKQVRHFVTFLRKKGKLPPKN